MSFLIVCPSGLGQPHPLGHIFACDCEPGFVLARLGKQTQAVEEAQRLEHGGIDPDSYGMVTLLDPLQGWPTCECAVRDDFGRQTATSTRIAYIESKLPEGPPDRHGRPVRRRHFVTFVLHYMALV
jgi:hypothetical protein